MQSQAGHVEHDGLTPQFGKNTMVWHGFIFSVPMHADPTRSVSLLLSYAKVLRSDENCSAVGAAALQLPRILHVSTAGALSPCSMRLNQLSLHASCNPRNKNINAFRMAFELHGALNKLLHGNVTTSANEKHKHHFAAACGVPTAVDVLLDASS